MAKGFKDYKDLTGLLLGPIRERPAMYLGEGKISKLQNFIFGYSIGFLMAKQSDKQIDTYFDKPGFLDWFTEKYNIKQTNFWYAPFLDEANGDEKLALELFFKYLEEYSKRETASTNKAL